MSPIQKFLDWFGIPVRDLAEALGVSHSQLLNMAASRRNVPAKTKVLLHHPLFQVSEPHEQESENPGEVLNEKEIKGLQINLLRTQLQLGRICDKLKLMQKRLVSAKRIIKHTESQVFKSPDKYIQMWLTWLEIRRNKAIFYLADRDRLKEWELEKKKVLLEKELEFWKEKMEKHGISPLDLK